MTIDKITISNLKSIINLTAKFIYPDSNIIVITGKNGIGKTSIVSALHMITDPQIIDKSSGVQAVNSNTVISFEIDGFEPFSFKFNSKIGALDSRDKIPNKDEIVAELPIPFGQRFQQYSLIASFDAEIRVNIASNQYLPADEIIAFLSSIYSIDKFQNLKATKIGKNTFYFILAEDDRYIREDHFSSGEFFLIQLYRFITSGAKLIIIDELDVSLDAAAQVKLYETLKPILLKHSSRMIVISHSLAFMNTVDDGTLYYLETIEGNTLLEQRSLGYIKSDLYSFRGKDRFIITEDQILEGFLRYLINKHIKPFYEFEIIPVGGEPQIRQITLKNDKDEIFGRSEQVITVVDKDIYGKINYQSRSKLYCSPIDDMELYIWLHREALLSDIEQPVFKEAKKEKATAKTYWKKVIASKQKTAFDLYALLESKHEEHLSELIGALQSHLCIP